MTVRQEYAEALREGEVRRDSSDKIRGFLYQDLIAIELILKSKDEDKIYVEWIEDIFVENTKSISIYQVKHYPESSLNLNDIYKDMFYQYVRTKLYELDQKDFKTFCIFHSKYYTDVDKTLVLKSLKEGSMSDSINKEAVIKRLSQCSDMEKRKTFIFTEVACSELLDEFDFRKIEYPNISDFRKELREKLFNGFDGKDKLQIANMDSAKEILLAVAIQYIQTSYYKKQNDYNLRVMTKESFVRYLNKIVGTGEEAYTERIKFIVLGYIDNIFQSLLEEIEKEDNLKVYKEIYFSTKSFFDKILKNKEQRFKFINTISTERYEVLNKQNYFLNSKEDEVYLEHKDKIIAFITAVWKILFNIDCLNFSEYIRETEDCFLFNFPREKAKPSILISPRAGESKREANHVLPRIVKMKERPRKWYFKGMKGGVYEYPYDIDKVKYKLKALEEYSILKLNENYFRIECMECLKLDDGDWEEKDNDSYFDIKCKGGVNE